MENLNDIMGYVSKNDCDFEDEIYRVSFDGLVICNGCMKKKFSVYEKSTGASYRVKYVEERD